MCASRVQGLSYKHVGSGRHMGEGLRGIELLVYDRVGQIFVKIASLDQSERVKEPLIQHIVVIGVLSLKIWISDANCDWSLPQRRLADGGRDILRIGPGKPATVDQPKIGILVQCEAERRAGQYIEIISSGLEGKRSWWRRGTPIEAQCVHMGRFESDAGDQADTAGEFDGVHDIAGGNAFDQVEVVGVDARASSQHKTLMCKNLDLGVVSDGRILAVGA